MSNDLQIIFFNDKRFYGSNKHKGICFDYILMYKNEYNLCLVLFNIMLDWCEMYDRKLSAISLSFMLKFFMIKQILFFNNKIRFQGRVDKKGTGNISWHLTLNLWLMRYLLFLIKFVVPSGYFGIHFSLRIPIFVVWGKLYFRENVNSWIFT